MARARLLGARVQGRTSPNPPVGAVVLDAAGDPVGEGGTAPAGGPHAEVTALAAAGERARGGTLVVTLEPCDHTGRTGPCTAAILQAGIATVVVATPEPTDEASGGADHLAREGVEVVTGFETAEAVAGALGPWLHAVRTGRPFVTWKFGATLDGRVAAADRTSRWITGEAARRDVHALRARVDAIVVGSGTVLVDDPQLTVRDADGENAEHQPLRVVLDRRHRVPDTARVLDDAAETVLLDTAVPRFALKALYDRGVRHVLVEGGPTVAGAFLEGRLVDEVVGYLAPLLLGSGPSLLADAGVDTLADAVTLSLDSVERVGEDLRLVARPRYPGDRDQDRSWGDS
ncbi:bifunctional diaminohydroxyphosphoribosylaminopyrimidine deaminase/5-amino-6-(5-phosphoribosylamino)uracil reductase RibD [Jatrophihabitans sp. YIM 134969]